jgi:hypothetical protein
MTETIKVQEKPAMRLSRKKQLLFSLLIFMLFLGLLEVALRLLDLPPTLKQDAGLSYSTNNAMGFEHTPNWSGYHAGAMMTMNSFGFRGKEFSHTKAPGAIRVLGLGDSFTLGAAVGDEDTYLAQLEALLNRDGGARYETINAGHQNTNTQQQARYLQERNLMSLAPDVVIHGFTMQNDANLAKVSKFGRSFKKELAKASVVLRVTNSETFKDLSASCRLVRILGSGVDWIYQDTISEVSYRITVEQYEDGSKTWEACRNSLLDIYEVCRKSNTPLIVVLFPIFTRRSDQTFAAYPQEALQIHEKLKAVFADKSGVMFVSLFDDLAATGLTTKEFRVPIDGHPNRLWHEITAKRLYASLKELGL